MITRLAFLRSSSAALSLASAPVNWSFPGIVAAYARRLDAASPFVSHHAWAVLPAASVIKVLILLAAIREMEATGRSWSGTLRVRASDVVAGSDTFGTARPGEKATFERLARAMIAQSDNTAANVFTDWLGYARIDAMGAAAGLDETAMRRHFMDFKARGAGVDNTTCARDMGELLFGIGNGVANGFAGVSAAGCRKIVGFMLAQEDRDTIPAALARGVSVANKTGVLVGVRNDIAIVRPGEPGAYAVALLSAGFTGTAAAMARLKALAARIDALSAAAETSMVL
jgi:beta-lactamase class A